MGIALTVGVFICMISLTCVFIFIFLDTWIKKQIQSQDNQLKNFQTVQPLNQNDNNKVDQDESIENQNKFHCKDVLKLPLAFWLLMLNCLFIYSSYSSMNISNDYYCIRYGFDQIEAARIVSNSLFICIILAPIIGIISDKWGNRLTSLLLAAIFLSLTQILFIYIPSSTSENKSYFGYIPAIMQVISSTTYSCMMFPLITLVTSQDALGTAYGINASCINFAQSFSPLIVGALTFKTLKEETYFWVNVCTLILCCSSVALTICMLFYNSIYMEGLLQSKSDHSKAEENMLISNTYERSDFQK